MVLVAAAASSLAVDDAAAWSYGSYGSHGGYASYGSYASHGSYASQGSHGSYGGPLRRMAARVRARRAARASYGSYGSHGSYASYGGYASHGSYGSHGGHHVSYGSHGGHAVSHGSHGGYASSGEVSTATYAAASTGKASIHVSLPADAAVFVNDRETSSTGDSRSFVSRGLREGMSYSYRLRVEYEVDGKRIVENKTLKLSAGDTIDLAFPAAGQQLASVEPVRTELRVSVPEDAQVYLAGVKTAQTGSDRVYTTSQLTGGQQWSDYTVRVVLDRDGQQLVEERTLTVEAGETYELAFEFADEQPVQLAGVGG